MAEISRSDKRMTVRLRLRNSSETESMPVAERKSEDVGPLKLWIPLKRRRLVEDGDREIANPASHGETHENEDGFEDNHSLDGDRNDDYEEWFTAGSSRRVARRTGSASRSLRITLPSGRSSYNHSSADAVPEAFDRRLYDELFHDDVDRAHTGQARSTQAGSSQRLTSPSAPHIPAWVQDPCGPPSPRLLPTKSRDNDAYPFVPASHLYLPTKSRDTDGYPFLPASHLPYVPAKSRESDGHPGSPPGLHSPMGFPTFLRSPAVSPTQNRCSTPRAVAGHSNQHFRQSTVQRPAGTPALPGSFMPEDDYMDSLVGSCQPLPDRHVRGGYGGLPRSRARASPAYSPDSPPHLPTRYQHMADWARPGRMHRARALRERYAKDNDSDDLKYSKEEDGSSGRSRSSSSSSGSETDSSDDGQRAASPSHGAAHGRGREATRAARHKQTGPAAMRNHPDLPGLPASREPPHIKCAYLDRLLSRHRLARGRDAAAGSDCDDNLQGAGRPDAPVPACARSLPAANDEGRLDGRYRPYTGLEAALLEDPFQLGPASLPAAAQPLDIGGDRVRGDGLRGDGLRGDGLRGDGLRGDGLRGDGLRGDGLRGDVLAHCNKQASQKARLPTQEGRLSSSYPWDADRSDQGKTTGRTAAVHESRAGDGMPDDFDKHARFEALMQTAFGDSSEAMSREVPEGGRKGLDGAGPSRPAVQKDVGRSLEDVGRRTEEVPDFTLTSAPAHRAQGHQNDAKVHQRRAEEEEDNEEEEEEEERIHDILSGVASAAVRAVTKEGDARGVDERHGGGQAGLQVVKQRRQSDSKLNERLVLKITRLSNLDSGPSRIQSTSPTTPSVARSNKETATAGDAAGPADVAPSNPPSSRPCFCGQTSSSSKTVPCSTAGCRNVQHLACMGVQTARLPQRHYCPSCRFKLVEAFWHPVENLLTRTQANVTPLTTRAEHGTMAIDHTVVFTLTPQTVRQLNSSGPSRIRLRLACLHLADTQPYRCHWPRQATLEVNGCSKKLCKRDTCKQLADDQFDEAADISAMVRAGSNTMKLRFRTTRRFMLQLSLCKPRSTQEVKALICAAPSVQEALTAMRQRVGAGDEVGGDDSDSDLVDSGSLVLSLRCPLMGCRIKTPVIFKDKPGLPAMDLDSFLAVAKQTSRPLTCPHSRRHVSITQLLPDVYLQRVLQCLDSRAHADVTEVEVGKDGRWRPAGSDTNPWWSVSEDPLQPYPSLQQSAQPAVQLDMDIVDLCDSDGEQQPKAQRVQKQPQQDLDDDEEFNDIYNSNAVVAAQRNTDADAAHLAVQAHLAGPSTVPCVLPSSPDVEYINSIDGREEVTQSPGASESSAHDGDMQDTFAELMDALFRGDSGVLGGGRQDVSATRQWPSGGLGQMPSSCSTHASPVVGAHDFTTTWPINPLNLHSTPQPTPSGFTIPFSMAALPASNQRQSSQPDRTPFGTVAASTDPYTGVSPFPVAKPAAPNPSHVSLPTSLAHKNHLALMNMYLHQKHLVHPPQPSAAHGLHPAGMAPFGTSSLQPAAVHSYLHRAAVLPDPPRVLNNRASDVGSVRTGALPAGLDITCPWATSGQLDALAPGRLSSGLRERAGSSRAPGQAAEANRRGALRLGAAPQDDGCEVVDLVDSD